MYRFAMVAALLLATAAGRGVADIRMFVETYQTNTRVPTFAADFWTVDLMMELWGMDDWLTTTCQAEILGPGVFWEHAFGGDTPPSKALVAAFPELEYDSFYAAAARDTWNKPAQAAPSFGGGGPANEPKHRWGDNVPPPGGDGDLTWFKTPPNGGDGVWLLSRYTMRDVEAGTSVLHIFHGPGGGTRTLNPWTKTRFEYRLLVPEPGTAALVTAGSLVVLRRRTGRQAARGTEPNPSAHERKSTDAPAD